MSKSKPDQSAFPPGVSKPAQRALASIVVLERALAEQGRAFKS